MGAIAIYGGDSRTEQLGFPDGYDIRFFQSARDGGTGECQRLLSSLRQKKIDTLIMLAKFMGHSDYDALKRAGKTYARAVITWNKGPGELARQFSDLVPPSPRVIVESEKKENWIEAFNKAQEQNQETHKEVIAVENTARKWLPGMAKLSPEQVEELRSYWNTGKYRQAELGRMFGVAQSSVSYMVRGLRNHGTDGSRSSGSAVGAVKRVSDKKAKPLLAQSPAVAPSVPEKPPVIAAIDAFREDWRAFSDLLLQAHGDMKTEISAMREENEQLRTMIDSLRKAVSEFRLNAVRGESKLF